MTNGNTIALRHQGVVQATQRPADREADPRRAEMVMGAAVVA